MKYRIHNNNKIPPINSVILIPRSDTTNMIGIVEFTKDDDIYVLLLDRNGRIKISKNDDWIIVSITSLNVLRNAYKLYCNSNVNNLLQNGYASFKAKYKI